MKKLKRFNKSNKKNIMPLVALCLVVAIVSAAISYAVYQKEDEIPFINARVGQFETTSSDIELAMKLDGEDVDVPPEKNELYEIVVECDYATATWNKVEWGADIRNITSNRVKCEVNFETPVPVLSDVIVESEQTNITLSYTISGIGTSTTCKWGMKEKVYDKESTEVTNLNCSITGLNMDTTYYYQVCAVNNRGEECKEGSIKTKPEGDPISIVKIGDYISMTPTSTSYTPLGEDTGCMNDNNCTQNTINPSELNLWRVIRKNDDGTVDVISERISSKKILFYGVSGYKNYVGGLNTIAAQYANSKYVQKTRHMGYSNQIEKCSGEIVYGLEEPCPSDTGYEIDKELVIKAVGSLSSSSPSNSESLYFLASRKSELGWAPTTGNGQYVSGYTTNGTNISTGPISARLEPGSYWNYTLGASIRPVLTLKSYITVISGDGKSAETAYQLS